MIIHVWSVCHITITEKKWPLLDAVECGTIESKVVVDSHLDEQGQILGIGSAARTSESLEIPNWYKNCLIAATTLMGVKEFEIKKLISET